MTSSIRNRRLQAVKLADALNASEGVPVSEYAKQLSWQWASGELTDEQMKSALMEYYQQIAKNNQ